jgi:uncharacterized protein YhbP (UPF0306 family)
MRKEVLDFIATQRLGVLAVEMLDGAPHAATVHVACNKNASVFYFETYRSYRKAEPLFGRDVSRASLVIGFDESNMKTLQIDGEMRLLATELEKKEFEEFYLSKFPNKKLKVPNPDFIPFLFIPKWWRFTDWTQPEGKIVYNSID